MNLDVQLNDKANVTLISNNRAGGRMTYLRNGDCGNYHGSQQRITVQYEQPSCRSPSSPQHVILVLIGDDVFKTNKGYRYRTVNAIESRKPELSLPIDAVVTRLLVKLKAE